MNQLIVERLEVATARLGRHDALSGEVCQSAVERCLETKRLLGHRAMRERAIHGDEPQEVRRWLRELPMSAEAQVLVLWPALRSGISTTYGGFVEAYDDLWLPSADDVWVAPTSGDWLLELDHEELLRFFV